MTDTHEHHTPAHTRGSLVDEALHDAPAPRAPIAQRLSAAGRAWAARVRTHRPSQAMLALSGVLLIASVSIAAHAALSPRPDPDDWLDRIDADFEAVLLDDAFNKLPIDQRVEMIGALVRKVKGMGSGDSVLLAALASRLEGSAREQLVENASRVMVDLLDRAGQGYDPSAPSGDRVEQIESSVVDLMRAMRTMGGEEGEASDEELLTEAREQAARDAQHGRERGVSPEQAGRLFTLANTTIGRHSSATEKARMATFARDMGRVLRGEDPATGKKNKP